MEGKPSSRMIRSFVACPLDAGLVPRVVEVQERLREACADVKWVEPRNLHFTLKFLGEVDEGLISAMGEGLRGALKHHEAFTLEISGLGAFPSIAAPRVVWAGVGRGGTELESLARSIEDIAAGLGIPREKKGFSPHLTLGRVRSPRNLERLTRILRSEAPGVLGTMQVREVVLMRSQLAGTGPTYSALLRIPLVAGTSVLC
ncbi:MAG TPA: RNA 2',3'-cyclic phosphodiesterase [Firmicutes bacterium]|nr:RNA 2',3'-cyclic phosphodiesterase [Bacillota bacterium]